jgi:hypothetical protein
LKVIHKNLVLLDKGATLKPGYFIYGFINGIRMSFGIDTAYLVIEGFYNKGDYGNHA